MKRVVSLFLILCLILSLSAFSCSVVSAEEGRGLVFVATNGKDTAAGTIDDPLATVFAAQKKVREMKASGLYPKGITVFIRGGNYNVSQSLRLTKEDSGTETAPIIWRNYEDETVTFTAGVNVSGSSFKKVTDKAILNRIVDAGARDSLYSLDLKKYGVDDVGEPYLFGAYSYTSEFTPTLTTKPKAPSMEVFFNDEPMTNARYPNDGWLYVEKVIDPGYDSDTKIVPHGTPFVITIDDDRMKYWTTAPKDSIVMFGYWAYEWADQSVPLASVDPNNKSITSKWHAFSGVSPEKPFYVTNLLEELDRPGEYYVDRASSTLYINPTSDIKSAQITLTVMEDPVFYVDGGSHITFKGIDVKGARSNAYFTEKGSSYIKVVDSEISLTASFGAIFYGDHNGISDSYLHDLDGGVRTYDGDIGRLIAAENYCINNEIENFARLTKTYKAAIAIDGVGNIAAHNEIHGSPHQAIAYGGQLNKIMYNDIYDVMQDTDDAGAIYGGLSWVSRGHEVKYNYIHDIKNVGSNAVGLFSIYGDGGQCEMYICGNIIENVDGGGVLVNGGWDNIVLNNIFINADSGIDVSAIMNGADMQGFYSHHYPRMQAIEDEIYAYDAWEKVFPTFYAMMAVEDTVKAVPHNNVIANNVGYKMDVVTPRTYTNADVVENNLKINSDPGFVDLKNRDYNLKEDAPIFDQIPGFKPIAFSRIGRLDDLALARVQDAVVMSIGSPKAMVGSKLVPIDENSTAVAPFIDGDRTYVPLRFLSENLGAKVDFADGVITIADASVSLEMTLNSTEAKKNGEAVTLDKAPVVIDGRTMVPLRQVSELLDRQVFWHDSGFIAISDDPTLFDSEGDSDENIINFLREKINYYN